MTKSHASGRGSGQPTPAQMKEFYAQVDAGKITRGGFQEFLRGGSHVLNLNEAKEIVGKENFFGPNEWLKLVTKKFSLSKIPEIPWSAGELEDPGINQDHFLFLGVDRLDNKPFDLTALHKFCPGPGHPKFYWDWDLSQNFAKKTCGLRWYLMPVGILEGSTSLFYDRQVAMLPDGYEVPTATERATANVLFHFLNGKYLDEEYWARVKDESNGGYRVFVLGGSDGGVDVSYWDDYADSYFGLAASRKF